MKGHKKGNKKSHDHKVMHELELLKILLLILLVLVLISMGMSYLRGGGVTWSAACTRPW